jgi:hypothetical protein
MELRQPRLHRGAQGAARARHRDGDALILPSRQARHQSLPQLIRRHRLERCGVCQDLMRAMCGALCRPLAWNGQQH